VCGVYWGPAVFSHKRIEKEEEKKAGISLLGRAKTLGVNELVTIMGK